MSSTHNRFLLSALFLLASLLVGCSTSGTNVPQTTSSPAITAKAKFVYIGGQGGSISGYTVNTSTGALSPISGSPMKLGVSPSAVIHDPQNRFLIVADNGADLLHVLQIDNTTGALTEVAPSPYITKNEPGTVLTDPSGTHVYLYVTGQNVAYPGQGGNQIDAYNLGSTGVLTSVAGTPFLTGSASFSIAISTAMVIDTGGKFLYLEDGINLYTFGIDSNSGALSLMQTIPGPTLGGAIALDPSGNYLYVVGSGNNSILTYGVNATTGLLTQANLSQMLEKDGSYTIAVSPTGQYAYTIENNNDLVSYAISNGALTPIGTPYSGVYGLQIAVDPSGSFVYVPQACSNCPSGVYNVVNEFSIGSTGALSKVAGSPIASGVTPVGITVTSQ